MKWTTNHAVFVPEIDDEHKEIFAALGELQAAISRQSKTAEIVPLTRRLTSRIADHFAHEERLMRAARYGSIRWHKQQHDNALKRVRRLVERVEFGDPSAGVDLISNLSAWLHDHTRLSDTMLGAFLRNHNMCTISFHAGTKSLEACAWVDSQGNKLQFH